VPERKTLAELAEASGLPARTIRFYIARGLLDGPVKAGRDAVYTEAHAERLAQIRSLQENGRTLSEIARLLGSGNSTVEPAPASPWWQYAIADDVVVLTRADASPWRMRQVQEAIRDMADRLGNGNDWDTGKKGKRR
jgi:DNA-binding transcriptional MerR regulator